jgi:2-polyprenyl-3-methyl-5-hydroxy-6-metoxy-1,4-benzoquinol methylase
MTTDTRAPDTDDAGPAATEALAGRLFQTVLAVLDAQAVYLGDRLGYYRDLAVHGASTSTEVAGRTGTAERYVREWLEQQAVTGILTAEDDPARPGDALARRFTLPRGHEAPLLDVLSADHLVPLVRFAVAAGRQVDALAEAHRTGGGVSWAQQGTEVREAQAAANRPLFLGRLGSTLLPSVPDVDAALRRGGRVADVGCGYGWSSIGIAQAYPAATVDGYDVDEPSVQAARRNAAEAGVADRVHHHLADAATVDDAAGYDLVTAFECIHDLSDPVSVLAAMRRLVRPGGTVLVVDERVAEEFTAPGDEVERLMYGYSLACCLADGLSHQPSAATGTVMRPDTLRRYAREAGFADVEVLDLPDDFLRFYRLVG